MIEKVIKNIYGDTAEQYVPPPDWREQYAQYLAGFEAAEDKLKFNAEWRKS